jgi:hypothetical protein
MTPIDPLTEQKVTNKNIQQLNAYQYGKLIQLLRWAIVFLVLSLGSLSCYLGYLVFAQNQSDLVYFATPMGTFSGEKQIHPNAIARAHFEIENFATRFVQDAFAHSENNYRENIESALTVMTNEAGIALKKLFSDDVLFRAYKEFNGVTTVAVDQLHTNTASYPYSIDIHYKTSLKFLSGQEKIQTNHFKQGIQLTMEATTRCKKNPYGLIVTAFKFIDYAEN